VSVLSVPALDEARWPTLGPQVCRFIEERLVFGPGDLLGEPAHLDGEKRGLLYRMYEVYPRGATDANGKLIEGRRRFRRCCLSLQKGSAKTELAAWIAAVELHPEGPVRCIGFDEKGRPIGGPVTDPYIPMVAYTEEQTEDLAYAALKAILERSPVAQDFDIGLERILRRTGDGKAVALASAPDARDGARTTFSHKDETHRWHLPRLKRAHRTMLANLPKRLMADPWELETTTAYSPGEGSVAEETAEYARAVESGDIRDSRLFYFHRQAGDGYDLADVAQLRAAIVEAAGATTPWRDIDGIVDQWQDPRADRDYLERVYLNRPVATAAQAFDAERWRENARPGTRIEPGEVITLGFDGSLVEDATALIATHVRSGFQWVLGLWEKPATQAEAWAVPRDEVKAVLAEAFATWRVWRMYYDPSKWETQGAEWAGEYGDDVVVAWSTVLYRKMATALKAYANAIAVGDVSHDGNPAFARHIGNAVKNPQNFLDDDGAPLWLIRKERPGSPKKIDAAMAGCLSWRARTDALASGEPLEEQVAGIFWA
jgi:phage terminase large subunit-like protein